MRKTSIAIYAAAALGLCALTPQDAAALPAAAGAGKAVSQTAADGSGVVLVRGFHGGGFHGGGFRGGGFRGGGVRGAGFAAAHGVAEWGAERRGVAAAGARAGLTGAAADAT